MKNTLFLILFVISVVGSIVGAMNTIHRDSVIAECKKEIASLKAQIPAPKPAVKESALTLESTGEGNISVFFVKKSTDPTPQFRKLKNFIQATRSFSQASGTEILSVIPVGECAIIDGEPAYQTVVVTHTKPFVYP
jgi:hypothetical protein